MIRIHTGRRVPDCDDRREVVLHFRVNMELADETKRQTDRMVRSPRYKRGHLPRRLLGNSLSSICLKHSTNSSARFDNLCLPFQPSPTSEDQSNLNSTMMAPLSISKALCLIGLLGSVTAAPTEARSPTLSGASAESLDLDTRQNPANQNAGVLICESKQGGCGYEVTYNSGGSSQTVTFSSQGNLCAVRFFQKHTNSAGFYADLDAIGSNPGITIGYNPTGRKITLGSPNNVIEDPVTLQSLCNQALGWSTSSNTVDVANSALDQYTSIPNTPLF
ncbi:hypothetical protein BDV96DRAFT_173666 [Lophiotrema nucula]|uniref:Uncharacterized protein n=1 Tax=Lophiotrema nucula TaxID=690887 RepID=A0A6A5YWM1_9PLEO|nr:hypothetical protein BDV96DRAFT_173666 [Lophiotrema nucula]